MYKKILAGIVSIILIVNLIYFPSIASEYADTVDTVAKDTGNDLIFQDYTYKLNDNNEVVIVKYMGSDVSVAIPSSIEDKEVTIVGASAFSGCKSLTELNIPDTVTKIEHHAFFECSRLNSIRLSKSLKEMGENAFGKCTSLPSIEIPKSLEKCEKTHDILDGTAGGPFDSCASLKTVTFENGTDKIAENMFSGCTGLESIEIPETVTKINRAAFSLAENLKTVELPEGLSQIEWAAFAHCKSLEGVVIPDKVERISSLAFYDCKNLSSVKLSESLKEMGDNAFGKCTSLPSIEIPKSLEKCEKTHDILDGTAGGPFDSCASLKTVTFENGTDKIAENMFSGCTGLESIEIPETVTKINRAAFSLAENLKTVELPEGLSQIEWAAFAHCKSLEGVVIPDKVERISSLAFYDCKNLSSVKLSKSLKEMGDNAFGKCTSLLSIEIPKSLEKCEKTHDILDGTAGGPFDSCESLKTVTFENGTDKIAGNMFSGCTGLESIEIPKTVTKINRAAFSLAENLKTVELPEGVTQIEWAAFAHCTSLERAIIPESVERIADLAFYDCKNLKSIELSSTLKTIGENVFGKCENLLVYCNYYTNHPIYCIDNNLPFAPSDSGYNDTENLMIDRKKSMYAANINSATSNGCVPININYSVKRKWTNEISNQKIVAYIPKFTDLMEDTVQLDGKFIDDYTYDERTRRLTIPTGKDAGKIVYNIKIKSKEPMISYAYLSANKNGNTEVENIDVINETFQGITISAAETVGSKEFDISGIGPIASAIDIYLDGNKIKTVNSSKTGSWSADVSLEAPVDNYVYSMEAKSIDEYGTEISAATNVSYRISAPKLHTFKVKYQEHEETKSCDLLNAKEVKPKIYYVPECKFKFQVGFDNAEKIDKVYVTSTRNNEKKTIEAIYDSQTGMYLTDQYFDKDNPSYVPGTLSVDYTEKKTPVIVSESYDVQPIKNMLDKNLQNAEIEYVTKEENKIEANIDLSSVFQDVSDAVINASVEYIDVEVGTSASDILDGLGFTKDALSYVVPGVDDKKYIYNVDWSDPENLLMAAYDVSEGVSKIAYFQLKMNENINLESYVKLFDKAEKISGISKTLKAVYNMYGIYKDNAELEKEIMQSGTIKNKGEALGKANELKYDRYAFTAVMMVLPLIAAGPEMAAAGVVFSGILSIMSALSDVIFDMRIAQYKGGIFKPNWVIDPSGIVTDWQTKEPMENAVVTAYWIPYDDTEDFWDKPPAFDNFGTVWNALEYEQMNPLLTNADGKYAWDVPEGWWRVKCEKDGYETVWTEWMTVPPVQTEVDILFAKESAKYAYEINPDKTTITITKCNSSEANITIPSSIDGYAVTGIGEYIFENAQFLKILTIPKSVLIIYKNAFLNSGISSIEYEGTSEDWQKIHIYEEGNTVFLNAKVAGADGKSFSADKNKWQEKPQKPSNPHQLTVTNSLKKTFGSKVFSVNAYSPTGAKLSYVSDNPKVAKADNNGKVTITGVGKAVITITANADEKYAAASAKTAITVIPKNISGVKAKAKSGGKCKVSWKKASKVSGYQIRYSAKSSMKSSRTAKAAGAGKSGITLKKLKKGKKYYIQVRAYQKVNGTTYYGNWSGKKKVKIR